MISENYLINNEKLKYLSEWEWKLRIIYDQFAKKNPLMREGIVCNKDVFVFVGTLSAWFHHNNIYYMYYSTHFGAGSPSASHSIMNGFSVSPNCATWKSISSAIGCFVIRGGEWTRLRREKLWWVKGYDLMTLKN